MKITHRDLKPENIVLQQEDSKVQFMLIVTDFSINFSGFLYFH